MKKVIYLDYHSTTPLDKRVVKAMRPYFSKHFGNPASLHSAGIKSAEAIEIAREQVSSIINADPEQLYFTSCATEANNIVLQGFCEKFMSTRKVKIITTNTEHSSINKCIDYIPKRYTWANKNDLEIVELNIDKDGNISLAQLKKELSGTQSHHVLVSIITANNEIGTIHPATEIGKICKRYGAYFHTDATQAIGKVDIDVDKMNIFALTASAHKIYGPKGVGALYVRDVDKIRPIIHGGYQDTISSGTQNVSGIVGMGKACEILQNEGKNENQRIGLLRDLLWRNISTSVDDVFINGTMKNRLTNNLNITIKGIEAEVFVRGMSNVIVSGGSACESGSLEPSHVIKALGTPYPECAIRFGLGRYTTEKEINYASKQIIKIINKIRKK